MQKLKIYIYIFDKSENILSKKLIFRSYSDTYDENNKHYKNVLKDSDKYEGNVKFDKIIDYYKKKYNNYEWVEIQIEEYYIDDRNNNNTSINDNTPGMPTIANKPIYYNIPINKTVNNNLQM